MSANVTVPKDAYPSSRISPVPTKSSDVQPGKTEEPTRLDAIFGILNIALLAGLLAAGFYLMMKYLL